ncbi:hypothetical protein R3P38DRAFT_1078396 [Favolaschia claudopus]|uniref:Uncharacterized protein n=1 Tax=Favolaschia claudopus TaxID=2862362 RepID=A0AAW0BCH1_9AGAR
MHPSAVWMARTISKPLKPNMQVFTSASTPKPTQPRIIPRGKIALNASIVPAAIPRNHETKPPTLIQTLIAQKDAAGDEWPSNLRIEPFISRAEWAPVKKGLRSKLKKMLREE